MNHIGKDSIITCLIVMLLLPFVVSCEWNGRLSEEEPVDIRIYSEGQTKVCNDGFELGDQVGLYMYREDTVYYNNMMYSFSADGFHAYDRMFYPSSADEISFYAYYPYSVDEIVSVRREFQWSVLERQWEDENYTNSDLMFGVRTVPNGTTPVDITLSHKMSSIDLVLVPGTGYTTQSLMDADISVTVRQVKMIATVFPDGTMEASGENADIEPRLKLVENSNGTVSGISAIIVPQVIKSGSRLLDILLDGVHYYYETDKELSFKSSRKMIIQLKISDRGVEFSSEIVGWNDGVVVSGELEEEEATVTDIDGNEYGIVSIGNQQWLDANLKSLRLNDGTSIKKGEMFDYMRGTDPIYDTCMVGSDVYLLYNYAAVSTGKLCPEGWRVPENKDFEELVEFLGSGAGKATKSVYGWTDGTQEDPAYQGNGDTDLSIYPVGFANADRYGQKDGCGLVARVWSSTTPIFDYAYSYIWQYNSDEIESDTRTNKNSALSVRCIKE